MVNVQDKKKVIWSVAAEKNGPLNKQLSAHGYFIRYVQEYKAFPNKDNFIKFMAAKQQSRFGIDTLPEQVVGMVDAIWLDYEPVLGKDFGLPGQTDKVPVDEFIRLAQEGMSLDTRGVIDGSE